MTTEGHPLPIIIKKEKTGNFELDEEALRSVLLRDDVKDKPVCVVAVAGGFRKGKSFLLNYFLRYCANHTSSKWMGDQTTPLTGFSWVKSSHRETTGILIWSEPFIVKLKTGKEAAVLLMDTQGTFDTKSSVKESTVVFALSLLTSSVLVYNLKENIGEDDLMNLDAFTQYGLLASEKIEEAEAFQKLLFLIRDWNHSDEFEYGVQGGKQFLEGVLEIKEEQEPAHQDLRRNLSKCFSDVDCYLMPHPGQSAHRDKEFDGRFSELSKEFVDHLGTLVPLLLAPENIQEKTLGGQTIKAKDLFNNFKLYIDAFNNKDLPAPTTVVESMAKASCEAAMRAAKELYEKEMKNMVRQDGVLSSVELGREHARSKEKALELFRTRSLKINMSILARYEKTLKEELDLEYIHYEELNETNNARKMAEEMRRRAEEERDGMMREAAMRAAKELYDKRMKDIVRPERVLSSNELEAEHLLRSHNALEFFRGRCQTMKKSTFDDSEKELKEELALAFARYEELNETYKARKEAEEERQRIEKERDEIEREAAMQAAKSHYDKEMKDIIHSKRKFSSDDLETEHSRLCQRAVELYQSRTRNKDKNITDSCERKLREEFARTFSYYKELNEANSARRKAEEELRQTEQKRVEVELEAAMRAAKELYEKGMNDIVRPEHLLSFDELEKEHLRWKQSALALYRSRKPYERTHESHEKRLEEELHLLYDQHKMQNKSNSEAKKQQAELQRTKEEWSTSEKSRNFYRLGFVSVIGIGVLAVVAFALCLALQKPDDGIKTATMGLVTAILFFVKSQFRW